MIEQKHLKQLIDMKRQKMISLAYLKGFTDENTVRCSQELDVLLNLYCRRTNKKAA